MAPNAAFATTTQFLPRALAWYRAASAARTRPAGGAAVVNARQAIGYRQSLLLGIQPGIAFSGAKPAWAAKMARREASS